MAAPGTTAVIGRRVDLDPPAARSRTPMTASSPDVSCSGSGTATHPGNTAGRQDGLLMTRTRNGDTRGLAGIDIPLGRTLYSVAYLASPTSSPTYARSRGVTGVLEDRLHRSASREGRNRPLRTQWRSGVSLRRGHGENGGQLPGSLGDRVPADVGRVEHLPRGDPMPAAARAGRTGAGVISLPGCVRGSRAGAQPRGRPVGPAPVQDGRPRERHARAPVRARRDAVQPRGLAGGHPHLRDRRHRPGGPRRRHGRVRGSARSRGRGSPRATCRT